MKKVEFHVHTKASKDSFLNKYFIYLVAKIKHIDCIAITDHNEVKFAIKNKQFFERKGIDIIIGEEIMTKDGEIIGLFLTNKIEPNQTAEYTIKEIKKQNGLVYIPHPYDEKRNKTVLKEEALKEICAYVDFIEVHNGRNIKEEYSNKQNEIAEKYNLRKIVGSDVHTFYELGRNYLLLDSYQRDSLIKNVEHATFKTKKCLTLAHHNTKFVRIIKMILRGDFHGVGRIINRKINRRK